MQRTTPDRPPAWFLKLTPYELVKKLKCKKSSRLPDTVAFKLIAPREISYSIFLLRLSHDLSTHVMSITVLLIVSNYLDSCHSNYVT